MRVSLLPFTPYILSFTFCIVRKIIFKQKTLTFLLPVCNFTNDTFEVFLRGSISDKTAFCLGEKQAMLGNDECSSWYNRVSDSLVSVWDTRKQLLCVNGSACTARQNNPTPECVVNGTECYDALSVSN